MLKHLARQVFRSQVRNYFDLFYLRNMSADEVGRLVDVSCALKLLSRDSQGRGTVLVAPHLGNLDVTGQMISLLEHDVLAVVERLEPDRLHKLVNSLRSKHGLELVSTEGDPRRLYRALETGRTLILAADRDTTGSGRSYEFFGAPAHLPDGYARIVRRTGSRLGLAHSVRLADDTFAIYGQWLPEVARTRDREADVRAIVDGVASRLEPVIAAHPEQWVMFRALWGRAPVNGASRVS
jgi:lauroyl/myristoyl acyltransferase